METVVFTNGCFDLLHPGHVDLLSRAKALGTRLVVGINSDESVRRIKGADRPFLNERERAALLNALESVDEVVVFDEQTPENLIREVDPDILVKGGDWKPEEIIGSDFVLSKGGQVYSLPLLEGYSSSGLVEKIQLPKNGTQPIGGTVGRSLREHLQTFNDLLSTCGPQIDECAQIILETVRNGGKILLCGNGGSAADAQHIAAEFVGRYETERQALPAIALTTDTSALTALANDYSFERIFARQVEALARAGDCLIAISTSGNSPNVISAVMTARNLGCRIVGMTGAKGKKLASLSDACLMVPSERTARVQEGHITVAHIWCELVDEAMVQVNDNPL
jgi:D-sedoheptulose 7-phosphate isomerase